MKTLHQIIKEIDNSYSLADRVELEKQKVARVTKLNEIYPLKQRNAWGAELSEALTRDYVAKFFDAKMRADIQRDIQNFFTEKCAAGELSSIDDARDMAIIYIAAAVMNGDQSL